MGREVSEAGRANLAKLAEEAKSPGASASFFPSPIATLAWQPNVSRCSWGDSSVPLPEGVSFHAARQGPAWNRFL